MYNEELKVRFFSEYPEATAKVYRASLMQIDDSEEFYRKDVFNFSFEQLDNAFKSIQAKTLSAVRRIVSPVLEYIRWANSEGFVPTKIGITDLFMGEKLNDYVWKQAQQSSYIRREEMYGLCEFLANAVDKTVLVLAYEGINGRENFEMLNLKFSDIDFSSKTIRVTNIDGEVRDVFIEDQETLDILKEARRESSYLLGNGDSPRSKRKEFDLVDTPYVIRKINRRRDAYDNEVVTIGFLLGKVTRIFKGKKDRATGDYTEEPYLSDCEFLNLTTLSKSGFFDYCMRLEEIKGELSTLDYEKACIRYGINRGNLQSYKRQYLDWKQSAR